MSASATGASAAAAAAASAAVQRHPWIELLSRQRAVLSAAWDARAELAGPRRLTDEAAFLPAALSLQETPVHPAPRRAMWVIMSLFVLTLAWSIIGQVDIVAVAPGRVLIGDRSKLIQPLEPGVVRVIHVRDGDRVKAGQVLVELDPTQAQADSATVREQQQSALADAQRAELLLKSIVSRQLALPETLEAAQKDLLQAEWAELQGRSAKWEAELARREAERVTVKASVEKLQVLLPISRQREADFALLRSEGAVAGHALQDRTRERIEVERDLATQQARQTEAEAALEESRRGHAADTAALTRTLNERLTKARLESGQLSQQASKTQQRESLTRLTAPVDGTVQQLAIHTAGGVVTPAQALMVIVPDGGAVIAEVTVPNQDIGFVHAGQRAEIKLDTFSFTRYGTVPAQVRHVSADAVVDDKGNAAFTATVAFDEDHLWVDGRRVKLAAGLNLVAEIKTGRRRVIEYVLGPVERAWRGAGRER